MTKFKNTDIDVQNIINQMSNNDIDAILYGIKSDIPILNLNAIIFGTKFKVKDVEFINTIKSTFTQSKVKFFGMELSEFAISSLHLLENRKYIGDNKTIIRLIKSGFDF